ncbi:MAG: glycosyltransferase, partial [bacterium]|nr:glycosyltransferase [bacterium]
SKNIVIVTDWIYGGGSEMVVLELHKMFPDAPIYTSYCTDEWREKLDNKVITGYLQQPPFRQLRKFLPLLRQFWFARLDLAEFDLVISVTGNGEAKFAQAREGAKHICYCNTPVHFYWRHYQEYLQNPGFKPAWLARLGLKLLVGPLKKRDYAAAQQVDVFLANSTHIQNDIKEFYGRDSKVVFPPVDTQKFTGSNTQPQSEKPISFVTHGRLVPMKRVDIIIDACNKLGLPLTVIGKGPEFENLAKLAGPTVIIKGFVPDDELAEELAKHSAYIFAAYEDFGIAPIEAMATGLPVIAYDAGGARDYIAPGKTGEFFDTQTVDALKAALVNFDPSKYSQNDLLEQAKKFSIANFKANVFPIIESRK